MVQQALALVDVGVDRSAHERVGKAEPRTGRQEPRFTESGGSTKRRLLVDVGQPRRISELGVLEHRDGAREPGCCNRGP